MQPTLVRSLHSSKGDRMDLTLKIEIPPLELTEDEILADLNYGR